MKAAHTGDLDHLHDILSAGADVNQFGSYGTWVRGAVSIARTPAHICAMECRVECLFLLLQFGAYSNVIDEDGYTPAHYVCQKYISEGEIEQGLSRIAATCLKLLFAFGASWRVKTKSGVGLMEMATRSKSWDCVKVLQDKSN